MGDGRGGQGVRFYPRYPIFSRNLAALCPFSCDGTSNPNASARRSITLNEAQTAWRNRPHFDDSALVITAVRTTGPALDAALTVGTILVGAALTVLACAHLARRSR